MLYYRITGAKDSNESMARVMLSHNRAVLMCTTKIHGRAILSIFPPETILRGSNFYCKLDPVTLLPSFGQYREVSYKHTIQAINQVSVMYGDEDLGENQQRFNQVMALFRRAPVMTKDTADAVRRLFAKVLYPVNSVMAYHNGKSYFGTKLQHYRTVAVDDTPMSIVYKKTNVNYHLRANDTGIVTSVDDGGVAITANGKRRYAQRAPGFVPAVNVGDEIVQGQPLWRMDPYRWKGTIAYHLLTGMWQDKIFATRGSTEYVRAQFVTRPLMVCKMCLRPQANHVCSKCRIDDKPVITIPVTTGFWVSGGGPGVTADTVLRDFPALPRAIDVAEVAAKVRMWYRLQKKTLDKTRGGVIVSC